MIMTERFDAAIAYGLDLHREQLRKGTDIPYISHLMAVTAIVLENGGTEDEAIAAFLHDAAEDQGGQETLHEIDINFGKDVAAIVAGCTDAWTSPKPPWRQRKEEYIKHLANADESVLLVSLADKLHNARAILNDYQRLGDQLWMRFNASKEDILWYYKALAGTFAKTGFKPELVIEFKSVVARLKEEMKNKC